MLAILEFIDTNENWELYEQITTGQGLIILKRNN
jgi:hypothetical protein